MTIRLRPLILKSDPLLPRQYIPLFRPISVSLPVQFINFAFHVAVIRSVRTSKFRWSIFQHLPRNRYNKCSSQPSKKICGRKLTMFLLSCSLLYNQAWQTMVRCGYVAHNRLVSHNTFFQKKN